MQGLHQGVFSMKKNFSLFLLLVINSCALLLVLEYFLVSSSVIEDNVFRIAFEPSGMQLIYFYLSLPFFGIVAMISIAHSHYFELEKTLCSGLIVIWSCYFLLISYVDSILHFAIYGNLTLYYGSNIITFCAFVYITHLTYRQIYQILNNKPF